MSLGSQHVGLLGCGSLGGEGGDVALVDLPKASFRPHTRSAWAERGSRAGFARRFDVVGVVGVVSGDVHWLGGDVSGSLVGALFGRAFVEARRRVGGVSFARVLHEKETAFERRTSAEIAVKPTNGCAVAPTFVVFCTSAVLLVGGFAQAEDVL